MGTVLYGEAASERYQVRRYEKTKKTCMSGKDEKMKKAGIIGATGYAGNELVRILMGHKDVEIKWYGSRSYIDKKYAEVYQN